MAGAVEKAKSICKNGAFRTLGPRRPTCRQPLRIASNFPAEADHGHYGGSITMAVRASAAPKALAQEDDRSEAARHQPHMVSDRIWLPQVLEDAAGPKPDLPRSDYRDFGIECSLIDKSQSKSSRRFRPYVGSHCCFYGWGTECTTSFTSITDPCSS
jgi:hypothetical protein